MLLSVYGIFQARVLEWVAISQIMLFLTCKKCKYNPDTEVPKSHDTLVISPFK